MAEPLGKYDHGGDVYAHEGVIDFSANINPLGMPEEAVRALCDHAPDYEAYPDPACRKLRGALSQVEGVPANRIVCTAGASDLIERVCTAFQPREALLCGPCFSGYEQALERVGARVERHWLRDEDGYRVTDRILESGLLNRYGGAYDAGGSSRDVVFLCSPNNPTGITIPLDLVRRVAVAAERAHAIVVLDECFLDFTHADSAVALCEELGNLIVMRAFTKMYAMAGLRLGYGVCPDEECTDRLAAAGQLWAVSTPAQVAGVAALGAGGWIERTRDYIDRARTVLSAALERCGMRVIPGEANYLLFQSPRELYAPLLQRGFLIRRCGNFPGLDESWYRIAVRTEEENAAFVAALEEVCK